MARRYTGAAAGGRASKGVATSSSSAPLASLADLRSDPRNPRTIAPKALAGLGYAMAEFGDLSGITFNARTGELVAGHQRVRSLRDRFGDLPIETLPGDVDGERRGVIRDPEGHAWDVRIVDWPREKQLAANIQANNVATAGTFTADVGALLEEVQAGMPDLFAACLFDDLQASVDAALAEAAGPADKEWGSALGNLPTGDKAPFQTMTFTLADSQAEFVREALEAAKAAGDFGDTGNENSNGNALARICEAYLGR